VHLLHSFRYRGKTPRSLVPLQELFTQAGGRLFVAPGLREIVLLVASVLS
jgi:hypothetical protein